MSKNKPKTGTVRNFVAKNDFNVGGAHADKTKYKRRAKHRAGKSDMGREV